MLVGAIDVAPTMEVPLEGGPSAVVASPCHLVQQMLLFLAGPGLPLGLDYICIF